MERANQVRRIARLAVYGGGSVTAAGALFYGVILGQAMIARRTIPLPKDSPPDGDGLYGADLPGKPVRFLMLGDSSAAGYGVRMPQETVGAVIAAGLVERLGRPVLMRCLAVVGARSADLVPQVEAAVELNPEVVVICVGGNDVTHRTSVPLAVGHLIDAVRTLREAGAKVVVGTCPDLGTIRPIQRPLRWMAMLWSRQLAAAQTVAVIEAGGRTVSLADLLAPAFYRDPERLFSWDRFHPSADGYAAAAGALLPTVAAAIDPRFEQPLSAGEGVRTLPQAAAEAVNSAGTEVSRASVAGHEHGPGGRWAQLRHRAWWPRRPAVPRQTVPIESTMETA
jgi:lysophospholipase L1-like esterase